MNICLFPDRVIIFYKLKIFFLIGQSRDNDNNYINSVGRTTINLVLLVKWKSSSIVVRIIIHKRRKYSLGRFLCRHMMRETHIFVKIQNQNVLTQSLQVETELTKIG